MTAIESIGDIVEQMKGLALSAKNDASATNPIKDVEEKPGKAGKSGGKWGKGFLNTAKFLKIIYTGMKS